MASNYKLTYNVDMVFCIDCTGSMENIIDMVKDNALNLYQDVTNVIAEKNKHVDQLRVKVVAYRDYLADGKDAMRVTGFFNLPQQSGDFKECVNSLQAMGGGDDPEDGLEALAYAIKSDWTKEGTKRRQVIVVWTDASTHPLGFGKSSEYYPKGMATDMNELISWWEGGRQENYVDNNAKRLLLFAPDEPAWNIVSRNWNNVIFFPSEAGKGLENFDYRAILDAISNSI